MEALLTVLWWLDRGWASLVARVAAVGAVPSSEPRPMRAVETDTRRKSEPYSEAGAVGGAEAADGGRNGRPATIGAAAEPMVTPHVKAVARKPAWLVETHPDPPGAAALAAHLDSRRAQAAGLRAMLFARQRRYAEAEDAFAQAAALDPALDLAGLDGFWDLGRGAHEAAVRAYDAAGRQRDAMLLRATLDGRYRPRLVRTA